MGWLVAPRDAGRAQAKPGFAFRVVGTRFESACCAGGCGDARLSLRGAGPQRLDRVSIPDCPWRLRRGRILIAVFPGRGLPGGRCGSTKPRLTISVRLESRQREREFPGPGGGSRSPLTRRVASLGHMIFDAPNRGVRNGAGRRPGRRDTLQEPGTATRDLPEKSR
jgi:hypothetical protein